MILSSNICGNHTAVEIRMLSFSRLNYNVLIAIRVHSGAYSGYHNIVLGSKEIAEPVLSEIEDRYYYSPKNNTIYYPEYRQFQHFDGQELRMFQKPEIEPSEEVLSKAISLYFQKFQ